VVSRGTSAKTAFRSVVVVALIFIFGVSGRQALSADRRSSGNSLPATGRKQTPLKSLSNPERNPLASNQRRHPKADPSGFP
jgi:hypothetical protein